MANPLDINDTIEVDGLDGLVSLLNNMFEAGNRPEMSTDNWTETILYLETVHHSYFENEAGPTGEVWRELSPQTILAKKDNRILIEYERLIDSLSESYHPDSIRIPIGNELYFGTLREWAWVHQVGVGIIPQREHTGVSEEGATEIAEMLANAVVMIMFTVVA